MQKRWLKLVLAILLGFLSFSCVYTKTFTPVEYTGVWRADYTGIEYSGLQITGAETLTLRADGTYQQIYDDGKGYIYTSPWNSWEFKSEEGLLYLRNGRFYGLGIQLAEQRAKNHGAICTYLAYSSLDEPLQIDCGDMVLYTLPEPNAKGGLILIYPELGDLDAPRHVKFYWLGTPLLKATKSP